MDLWQIMDLQVQLGRTLEMVGKEDPTYWETSLQLNFLKRIIDPITWVYPKERPVLSSFQLLPPNFAKDG